MSSKHIWHWFLPLHYIMSKDGYSAGFQQPSAPQDAHTVRLSLAVLLHMARTTFRCRDSNRCPLPPLCRTLPPWAACLVILAMELVQKRELVTAATSKVFPRVPTRKALNQAPDAKITTQLAVGPWQPNQIYRRIIVQKIVT